MPGQDIVNELLQLVPHLVRLERSLKANGNERSLSVFAPHLGSPELSAKSAIEGALGCRSSLDLILKKSPTGAILRTGSNSSISS